MKNWKIIESSEQESQYLYKQLLDASGKPLFPLSVVKILVTLGIKNPADAVRFFGPSIHMLHNPFLLKDMEKAVKRILEAIEKKQKILIHTDYDADGVTTAAVYKLAFQKLGIDVDVFLPNRFEDGYGLNKKNMEKFCKNYDLIISGDTGIRAFEGVDIMKGGRAELIVTDHHEPLVLPLARKDEIPANADAEIIGEWVMASPRAFAVINPKRLGDPYPCKSLSGAAVAFKFMQALYSVLEKEQKELNHLLDIVATGLVADLVEQIDTQEVDGVLIHDFEVRVMTHIGLHVMNKHPKAWVKAIRDVKKIEGDIQAKNHIGFRIGPLLNAVGRLEEGHPYAAYELLVENDFEKAKIIATELESFNKTRQEQTNSACEKVFLELEAKEHIPNGIVIAGSDFHKGIAGLIAGNVQKKYYKPCMALARYEKEGKILYTGSARSIPGIDLMDVLDKVKQKIGPFEYGGHEAAAGMTVPEALIPAFTRAVEEVCAGYPKEKFIPEVTYAAELDIKEATKELVKTIDRLEPFAKGNEKPVFRSNQVEVVDLQVSKGKYMRFSLKRGTTHIGAVMFELVPEVVEAYQEHLKQKEAYIFKEKKEHTPFLVDLLYTLEINRFRGEEEIQLLLCDVRVS